MPHDAEYMRYIASLPRNRSSEEKIKMKITKYHIAEALDISISTVRRDIEKGKLKMSDLISISSYITAKHRLQKP